MPGRSPSIYTTDQSDPRTSSTARVFITPIPIGTNGARETYVNAYIPSNDREKKNDSDVIAFCYNVNHDTPETVTNTPQPIPKTGDTARSFGSECCCRVLRASSYWLPKSRRRVNKKNKITKGFVTLL